MLTTPAPGARGSEFQAKFFCVTIFALKDLFSLQTNLREAAAIIEKKTLFASKKKKKEKWRRGRSDSIFW